MHLTEIAYCAGIALLPAFLCFIHKVALLRRIGRTPYGSDVYWYLLISRLKREQGPGMPPRIEAFLGSQEFYTPPLLMGLSSRIPPHLLERYHWLPSILAKTLLTYLLALVSGIALVRFGSEHIALGSSMAGLFYAWSPINRNANPSNLSDFNLSPRPLGTLLISLQGLTVLGAIWAHSWSLVGLSAIWAALALATSAFSAQCLVLGGLALSTFSASWMPIGSMVLGFLVVGIWNHAYVWKSLRNTLKAQKYYALENYKHCLGLVESAFCSLNFLRFFKYIFTARLGALVDLIHRDYVIRGLVFYPLHLLCLGLSVLERDWIRSHSCLSGTLFWWLSACFLFFVTSLPRLRFLGEADRYLEFFGYFPATLLVTVWLFSRMEPSLALGIIVMVYGSYLLIGDLFPPPQQSREEDKEDLWEYLRGLPVSGLVMVPVNLSFEAVYRTGHPCLFPLPLDARNSHLMHGYPIPILDKKVWEELGDISHLVVDRGTLERHKYVSDFVGDSLPIFESERFLVFSKALLCKSPQSQ